MVDGVEAGANPQSLFIDDLSLTSQSATAPEPSSAGLLAGGALLLG